MKSSNEVEGLKSHIHGTLHSRMSPSSIVQVMESVLLSQNKLKAVRDIGFGSMEFLKVTQLPLRLGLWLVQHFDAKTCSLNILDSDPFRITEDHVHEVLGLPIWGIEIDKNNFSRNKKVIQQWKKQFQINSLSIKIGELKEFLKEHKSAGAMFKRNFVVLCVSTLMDGKQNMNINSDILTFLSDVDKIKDLNWSKYILASLVKGKLLWEERPTRSFPGSLLFLIEVRAAREIPILKGWTTAMLSTREKLELFKGRLGNIRAKKLDAGSSSMTQPKMLIILTKLREKYTLGIITSEVNTIQSVKEIAQKKKKKSKVSVADKEENAEKEEPKEEKVQGRKSKRLKKAEC
uniref:Aminotransferase-like plant mobile domain-containing protein n=1 Tax=Chenopodium quinoa TaxID=63459 RepID=A0A803M1G5_CHEQI